MAQLGGMSSETFSAPSTGLGSILRDQKALTGVRSNRISVVLGITRPPVKQSLSVSSSPVESFLVDTDAAGDEVEEFKEEDIWSVDDPEEGRGFRTEDLGFSPKTKCNKVLDDIGAVRADTVEAVLPSRRRDSMYGIGEPFMSNGSMGISPLARALESSSSGGRSRMPARRSSASRMIPLLGGPGRDSPMRHAERQSAPVQVPNWTKLMGRDNKKTGDGGDNKEEDDEERLPPHELLARENARSQRTTFSVCEGLGRTLKGRDLSRVRNAVWSQMGFAD